MSEYDPGGRHRRPALGQPPQGADPDGDPDFASEHEETAVDDDIITGEDADREPEAPRGWAGMEPSPHHPLSGY